MHGPALTPLIGIAVLLLASCTESSEPEFRPTFQQGPCPDDVTHVVLTPVTCGFLTVPENRSEPGGGHHQALRHPDRAPRR